MVRLNDEWNQANETIGAANQCISIWNIKWIDNFLTHRGKGFFYVIEGLPNNKMSEKCDCRVKSEKFTYSFLLF